MTRRKCDDFVTKIKETDRKPAGQKTGALILRTVRIVGLEIIGVTGASDGGECMSLGTHIPGAKSVPVMENIKIVKS